MKKLIVFGIAAIAACAVNAASFSWAAASVNGTDGNGNVLTSTEDAAKVVLVYLGNGTADWDNAVAVQTGTWTIKSAKGKDTATVGGAYDGSGTGGLADGNIYAVMVEDDNGGLHQIAGTSTYTVTGYSGDTWSGTQFTFATSNYIADKASYGGGVPEPTSGLLLLVGGALLALRRKRA